jgi:hypothetical protein
MTDYFVLYGYLRCRVRKIWGTLYNPTALASQKTAALLAFILGLLVLNIALVPCVPAAQVELMLERFVFPCPSILLLKLSN